MDSLFGSYFQDSLGALKRIPADLKRYLGHSPDKMARGILGPAHDTVMMGARMVGPQADVADYVDFTQDAVTAAKQGRYGDAVTNSLFGAAAIPFMFLPGGVTALRGGPKLSAEDANRIMTSNSRKRRKWGAERKQQHKTIVELQAARAEANAGIDPLVAANRSRDYRLGKIKAQNKAADISGGFWNKKFQEEVRRDISIGYNAGDSVNRANLEAIPRALKKMGWSVRHASKAGGRKNSRYLVSPDGQFEVRISDHYLPETPQRNYNRDVFGQPRWNEEILLSGQDRPQDIINEILDMYGEN
jgi:hypothetical protein|tara:strand:- start:12395 stop:13300 length:906 start_codon:yes stop_codon:yes gene_type:complete